MNLNKYMSKRKKRLIKSFNISSNIDKILFLIRFHLRINLRKKQLHEEISIL